MPVDWLKPIWKTEKLNKIVQLTVSGCLGPCDLPNVCCIITENEQAWYGRLTTLEDYGVLLNWARRCKEQNCLQPLPSELEHLRFERWPGQQKEGQFSFINQDPADIVLLTAADTELLTWSAAAARLPAGFPSIRALNLDRLRDQRVFDAYQDDVLQECRVLVVRLLGGLGYWREPLEQIRLLAMAHDIRLICLPGDDVPDAQLAAYSTVALHEADAFVDELRPVFLGRLRNELRDLVLARALLFDLSDRLTAVLVGMALWATQPDWRNKVTYLQITPKSRGDIREYADMAQVINAAAGRINGTYGEADWTPIRYINRAYSRSSLAGLYRAARAGLVTPLRDGMNLVAKEYVAAQNPDDPGVLILSRFAGAWWRSTA